MAMASMPAERLGARDRRDLNELYDLIDQHADEADRLGRPAPEVLAAVRASDLPGLVVPVRYGGSGADALTANRRIAELAYHDASIAIIMFLHMAVCSRVSDWGTPAQKARVLPRLASGEFLAASAWSETGSDAAKTTLATKAEPLPGGGWRVSGGKAFATGASIADCYLILAQTAEPSDNHSGYGRYGQSLFLIPGDTPGVVPGATLDLVGMRASATGFVELHGCEVPGDAVVGPLHEAHKPISAVRETGSTLGAVAVGVAEAAWDTAFEVIRGRGVLDHEATRFRLMDLRSQIEAARALVDRAGRRESADPGALTLHSKVFAAQAAEDVTLGVSRLLGSAGYLTTNPINRRVREARAVGLMGPTNDLSRELVSAQWLR
jgi:alkylation response protein AidB-like acyl-CoA dehydrogenase